jgi:hypothetical protein
LEDMAREAAMSVLKLSTIVLLLSTVGCASQSFDGICGLAIIGQNEQGIAFARVHCESEK